MPAGDRAGACGGLPFGSPDTREEAAILAAKTIRGVALESLSRALVQSLIGGGGLLVAGVPFPALLAAVIFILA